MKKIIDMKRYDTSTAELVSSWANSTDRSTIARRVKI